ncbi:MAG: hypothetical protein LW834_08000 [Cyanobium sp. 49614_E6]|nr:hypothetical protein [Cyanobium sp. 49614_E6]
MIAPSHLAALRRRHRAELILVLVQLEQLCPGTWDNLGDLAEQLGTDRATLNRSISQLRRLGLIGCVSRSNGGTWLWWVSRHDGDAPAPEDEPAWVLRSHPCRYTRIPLTGTREWAQRRGIPYPTLRSFLAGHQRVLRGTWQLASTPFDTVSND